MTLCEEAGFLRISVLDAAINSSVTCASDFLFVPDALGDSVESPAFSRATSVRASPAAAALPARAAEDTSSGPLVITAHAFAPIKAAAWLSGKLSIN